MGFLTGKKLLVLGFIVILLAAIPITLFLIRTKSIDTRTRATPATRLYFMQNNSQQFPIQKNVGDTFTLDLMMDPGSNQVIAVALNITYDTTKLSVPQGGGLKEESSAFSSVLEPPVYNNGNITMTMTIGVDVTKAIKTTTKIATLTLKADNPTGPVPAQIIIAPSSQVTSTADPDVNVLLSNPPPASVLIGGVMTPPTITPTPRVGTTATPAVATATPPIGGTNQAPVCTEFQASTATGTAPLSVSFTARGTDTGGKLTKATFNFGDGSVQDVTKGTGIGSNSATVQADHTYSAAGKFSASVLFTDDGNAASSTISCTQIITVEEAPTPTSEVIPTKGFPPGTLKPGPGDTFIGVGVIAAILAIIGGVFFFAL